MKNAGAIAIRMRAATPRSHIPMVRQDVVSGTIRPLPMDMDAKQGSSSRMVATMGRRVACELVKTS